MAALPVNHKITIAPVSFASGLDNDFRVGTTDYTTLPAGPRVVVFNPSDVQILAIQRYIQSIRAGIVTTSVESAINALATP